MVKLVVAVVVAHVFHFHEDLDPRHDRLDLAGKPCHPDHLRQQVIVLQRLAALHGLHDRRIDVKLAIRQNFIVDGIGFLARFLLLDRVDLNPLQFGSEFKVYLELVFLCDHFSDDFAFLHYGWLVRGGALSHLRRLLVVDNDQYLVL